jgi:hypothetical protein
VFSCFGGSMRGGGRIGSEVWHGGNGAGRRVS